MADVDEDVIRRAPPPDPAGRSTSDNEEEDDDDGGDYATLAHGALPYDPTQIDALLAGDDPVDVAALRPAHLRAAAAAEHAGADSNTSAATAPTGAIPRRGDKDFEPNPTDAQARALTQARTAMSSALAHGRTHAPRTRVLGVYDAQTGRVVVRRRRGIWLATVGRDLPGGAVELMPEEVLWAVEGGRMDLRVRTASDVTSRDAEDEADADAQEERLPSMSVQAAYATFLGGAETARGLTIEKYVVFAGLKRAGYTVTRAEGFAGYKRMPKHSETQPADAAAKENEAASTKSDGNTFSWLYWVLAGQASEEAERERHRTGPLVRPGIYRSHRDIYRALDLVQAPQPYDPALHSYEPFDPTCEDQDLDSKTDTISTTYTTTYNIYQPSAPFRKRNSPPPSFRVCVVPARSTRFPTPQQIDGLLAEQPPDKGRAGGPGGGGEDTPESRKARSLGQTYAALKRGKTSVLLAVVDEGITSFMRVSEGAFAVEGRLFEREVVERGGKKGGGGRGGRGRGGRGRR